MGISIGAVFAMGFGLFIFCAIVCAVFSTAISKMG